VARVVAVGDIHGDYEQLQKVLRLCKLTDTQDRWIGGKTHLVQTGDVLDRGPESKKAMDLLIALESQAQQAGGAVHALIGNHEAMTLTGDLSFVSDGELAAFGDPPRTTPMGNEPFPNTRAAFSKTGKYGQWIISHSAIIKINETLFMHGGLSRKYMSRKLQDINDSLRLDLTGQKLGRIGVSADLDAPMWYRGLAEPMTDQALNEYLAELSRTQGAQRIVVGHTIQPNGITLKADGKVAIIDVGMSRWTETKGGKPTCLVIDRTDKGDQVSIVK
jgi:hypothetical protein